MTWPNSLGFVHVNESGTLSEALTAVFLPRRKAVLSAFLQQHCKGEEVPDDGTTVSGVALDAAN